MCEPVISNITYEDMLNDYDGCAESISNKCEYKCEACGNKYAHQPSLSRHRKTCRVLKLLHAVEERVHNTILQAQVNSNNQTNVNTTHIDSLNNTQNINNGTVNNNNVQQHLNLAPFGKECYDHITPREWREFAFSSYGGFDRLMERVFKGNPKNLNVRVRNTNKTYAEAWIPPNWETMDIKDITNRTVENCVDKFQEYASNNPDVIPPSQISEMDKTMNDIISDSKKGVARRKKARMIFENPTFRKYVESNYKELTNGSTINEHIV